MKSLRVFGLVCLTIIAVLFCCAFFLAGCANGKIDTEGIQRGNAELQKNMDLIAAQAKRAEDAAAAARDDAQKKASEIGEQLKAKLAAIDNAASKAEKDLAQAQLQEVQERLAVALAAAESAKAAADKTKQVTDKVASAAAATKVAGDAVRAAVTPEGDIDPIGAAGAIAPLLPPPVGGYVMAAGAVGSLITLVVREIQNQKRAKVAAEQQKAALDKQNEAMEALNSMATGIEVAKRGSTPLSAGLKDAAPILLDYYTPLAKEVVRKAAA